VCYQKHNPEFQEDSSITVLLPKIRKNIFLGKEVAARSFKEYRILVQETRVLEKNSGRELTLLLAVKKSEANTKYSDYGCLIVYVDKALVDSNLTTSQMLAK
jgi:hypothetical protein